MVMRISKELLFYIKKNSLSILPNDLMIFTLFNHKSLASYECLQWITHKSDTKSLAYHKTVKYV